jgi:hypothetical protein
LSADDLRAKALDWLRNNQAYKPGSRFEREMADRINAELDQGHGIFLELGDGTMKSERTTFLSLREGSFHVFQLTPEQTRNYKIRDGGVATVGIDKEAEPRLEKPAFILSDPQIVDGDRLHCDQEFKGSVLYRRVGKAGKNPKNPAVRVVFFYGGHRHTRAFYIKEPLETNRGALNFKVGPIDSQNKHFAWPLVLYVELCTVADVRRLDSATIISNTTATMIQCVPADDK